MEGRLSTNMFNSCINWRGFIRAFQTSCLKLKVSFIWTFATLSDLAITTQNAHMYFRLFVGLESEMLHGEYFFEFVCIIMVFALSKFGSLYFENFSIK